jgi:small subunit ribosomal protein S20
MGRQVPSHFIFDRRNGNFHVGLVFFARQIHLLHVQYRFACNKKVYSGFQGGLYAGLKVNFGGTALANIRSQIKRNHQNEKRRLRNRTYRGAARTAVKDARTALETKVDLQTSVMMALSMLDKAAKKGAIHPRNAARRKGRLMKRLAALGVQPQAAAAEPVQPVTETAAEKKPARAEKEPKAVKEAKPKTEKKKPAEKKTAVKKTAAKK